MHRITEITRRMLRACTVTGGRQAARCLRFRATYALVRVHTCSTVHTVRGAERRHSKRQADVGCVSTSASSSSSAWYLQESTSRAVTTMEISSVVEFSPMHRYRMLWRIPVKCCKCRSWSLLLRVLSNCRYVIFFSILNKYLNLNGFSYNFKVYCSWFLIEV